MAAASVGRSIGTVAAALNQRIILGYGQSCSVLLQTRHYAARKGTRERKKKKIVKKEVIKVPWTPYNLRVKKEEIVPFPTLRTEGENKTNPIDDVWFGEYYNRRYYTFEEAIQCQRETHHPSMYNLPNGFVYAYIEVFMQGERATKLVEKFSRVVDMPNPFDHGETRTVMAFSKDTQLLELADKAGATLSGGKELITKIQVGEINLDEFQYVVAHPEIMAELSVIRGLLKRKFPNPRTGTLGMNLPSLIEKIFNGIKYVVQPSPRQVLHGTTTVLFGRLNMDMNKLEENFEALIKDVENTRPRRDGEFVFRTSIKSVKTTELLKVYLQKYINESPEDVDSDEEDGRVISNTI